MRHFGAALLVPTTSISQRQNQADSSYFSQTSEKAHDENEIGFNLELRR